MRILTRYLVARFLGFFAALLIGSLLTIAVVEMMLNLGDMLREDEGLSGIVTYLVLRLPAYYLRDLVPMAAFGAAFFTLGTAARWLELLAAKAGGLSAQRIGVPLLGAAVLLTAASFVLNETWVLEATRRWNQRDARSDPIRFREGSFWYQRGRTIYNIEDANRATNTLRGVLVLELDDRGRLQRSIEAPEASVDPDGGLVFDSPRIRRFDAADRSRAPETERFEGPVRLELRESSGSALMTAELATLSLRELAQVTQASRGRRRAQESAALLHARLAEPLTVILFVLAAIPLGVHAERSGNQGMTAPALIGIGAVAVFFALRSVAETLAAGQLLPAPAPWALLAAFSALGTWRYTGMPT